MSEHIDVERDGGVAWLWLDRPDHQQALTTAMATGLREAATALAADDAVRVIALAATGEAFCTGADLRAFEGDSSDERRLWAVARRLHGAIHALISAPKPVVTAVDGTVAGGGLGLALCGDLVYMADDATLEFAYPRIGLSGDGGTSYLLPALVGLRGAREIALLDEPIGADAAAERGLVTEAVAAGTVAETVASTADELADGPTLAYGRFKRLTLEAYGRTFRDQLRTETEVISRLARSDDYAEGYRAFMAGEAPAFTGE